MTRAGREPAEDVKRRLVAACREAGLEVKSARMHLLKEHSTRLIHVEASPPEWSHEAELVSLMTYVSTNGSWPDRVKVSCAPAADNPMNLAAPLMRREPVRFSEVAEHLKETTEEHDIVISMVKDGMPEPYVFKRSVWKTVTVAFGDAGGADGEPF